MSKNRLDSVFIDYNEWEVSLIKNRRLVGFSAVFFFCSAVFTLLVAAIFPESLTVRRNSLLVLLICMVFVFVIATMILANRENTLYSRRDRFRQTTSYELKSIDSIEVTCEAVSRQGKIIIKRSTITLGDSCLREKDRKELEKLLNTYV